MSSYYERNKEKCKARFKEYYRKNRAKQLAKKKAYYEANTELCIARQMANDKDKYKTDINYKMKNIIRNRLRIALKKNTKVSKSMDYVGCSLGELRSYLESKFQPGMTWNNWSLNGWHVDHILPLDSFDLTDDEQLKQACHYTNLQPMWADENRKKYNHISNKETSCLNS